MRNCNTFTPPLVFDFQIIGGLLHIDSTKLNSESHPTNITSMSRKALVSENANAFYHANSSFWPQTSDIDTSNVDPSFTKEPVRMSSISPTNSVPVTGGSDGQEEGAFKGFSYSRPLTDSSSSEAEDTDEAPDR